MDKLVPKRGCRSDTPAWPLRHLVNTRTIASYKVCTEIRNTRMLTETVEKDNSRQFM